jgi:hypothetical protein
MSNNISKVIFQVFVWKNNIFHFLSVQNGVFCEANMNNMVQNDTSPIFKKIRQYWINKSRHNEYITFVCRLAHLNNFVSIFITDSFAWKRVRYMSSSHMALNRKILWSSKNKYCNASIFVIFHLFVQNLIFHF